MSEVTAPPSVLVDEVLQRHLYRQHPCNAIRLVLNREEPGDTAAMDRTLRADDFWRLWRREGILQREHDLALYIVETTFQMSGVERARWSVFGRLRLPDVPAESSEQISCAVAADAARIAQETELRTICNASLSPVVGLLSEVTGADADDRSLSDHLELFVRQMPPIECIEDNGTRHRIWPVTSQTAHTEFLERLSNFAVTIVGGAAEYHAGLAIRELEHSSDPNDPGKTTMICLIPADDAGIEFLPHVMILPASSKLSNPQTQQILSAEFSCQNVGSENTAGTDATELARLNSQQPCVAVGTQDGVWMIVSPKVTNEPLSSSELVRQISKAIGQSAGLSGSAVTQTIPWHSSDVSSFLQTLSKTVSGGLLIVEPAQTAAELCARTAEEPAWPEAAVRLHPPVPTGLVFSSMGHSRLP